MGLLIAVSQRMSEEEDTRRPKALPNTPSTILLLDLDVRFMTREVEADIKIAQ